MPTREGGGQIMAGVLKIKKEGFWAFKGDEHVNKAEKRVFFGAASFFLPSMLANRFKSSAFSAAAARVCVRLCAWSKKRLSSKNHR